MISLQFIRVWETEGNCVLATGGWEGKDRGHWDCLLTRAGAVGPDVKFIVEGSPLTALAPLESSPPCWQSWGRNCQHSALLVYEIVFDWMLGAQTQGGDRCIRCCVLRARTLRTERPSKPAAVGLGRTGSWSRCPFPSRPLLVLGGPCGCVLGRKRWFLQCRRWCGHLFFVVNSFVTDV